MGCCASRSSGPNLPYPGGATGTSSSHPINPVASNPPNNAQQPTPSINSQQPPRQRQQRPLDQHISKTLRRHEWVSRNRTWTRAQLARERVDFFDTRVTGRAEVWQTIHAALQALWEPEELSQGQGALETAQTILDAAEISLPTGDLADGAYDSLGNYYSIPEWIAGDPSNVIYSDDDDDDDDDVGGDVKGEVSTGADETAESDVERRREEKGKAVEDVTEPITVRARLSENGRDYQLTLSKTDLVKRAASQVAELAKLAPSKKVRIAYMGKMLKNNASLEAQGWQPGHIINAMVFNKDSS